MKRSSCRGMGGGSMLRAAGRAAGAGVSSVHEVFSATKPKPASILSASSCLSSPSPSSSSLSLPAGRRASPSSCDVDEWVVFQNNEAGAGGGGRGEFFERFVFGAPPSVDEVQDAVSAIRKVFLPATNEWRIEGKNSSSAPSEMGSRASSSEPEMDWMEPPLPLFSPTLTQPDGSNRVFDAFRLLQINPSVQRMVISLSSDEAVWDAVMNNEAVQEMKSSLRGVCAAASNEPRDSDENPATRILKSIMSVAKTKLLEFMETVTKLVSDLFLAPKAATTGGGFEEAVRSSFMLSVVVLLLVLVTRTQQS